MRDDDAGTPDTIIIVEGGENIFLLNERVADSKNFGITDFSGDRHPDILRIAENTTNEE